MSIKLESLFPGAQHIHFKEINSTNLFAQELLSKSLPPEGTTISADFQTHGRGQYGREWQSDSTNNLLCSIILYPQFLTAQQQFAISRLATKVIVSTLESYLPPEKIKIKWPNDIFYDNHKICGILIQNFLSGSKISASILGIGININQTKFPVPVIATSIRQVLGKQIDVYEVLSKMLSLLKPEYNILKTALDPHFSFYNEKLFRKGIVTDFDYEGKAIQAEVVGTDLQGRLILRNDGQNQKFVFGTLKWLNI